MTPPSITRNRRTWIWLLAPLLFVVQSLPAMAAASPACPAQGFDSFLHRFANDIAIQKAFVSDPLQSDTVQQVSQQLEKAQLSFPLMPNEQQQAQQGLSLSKAVVGPKEVMVQLTKANTDHPLSLFFRKEDCWTLYRIQNDAF